ncbi:MAG: fused MFS/spermidine synthase [Bifidobacteriaceae bacterium]|jgi:spermidine synthase|nr:fused MFS/spermidine synthase [Bifidobacteriaceae bacterium]
MHDDAIHTAIMGDVISLEPFPVDNGWAIFKADGDSVTLYINGWPSSQWSESRPAELEFEYMNWMLAAAGAIFAPQDALRCLHLGAAACSLPRALTHLWPRSRHLAVEIDAKLAAAVRAQVPLPRAPVLRIRVADAAVTLHARPPGSQDLIIRDVFDDRGQTPESLTGPAAAAAASDALTPDGIYLANCGDQPGLPCSRHEIRDLAAAFRYVAVVAEPGQWRGRRRGNAVLLASNTPWTPKQERDLARRLAGGFPARLLAGPEALRWAGL